MKYGFDADEALRMLCLENITVENDKNENVKKSKSNSKADKSNVSKKKTVPMPFIAELVDFSLCNALTYNKGLFTQCGKKQVEGSVYCKKCNADLGDVSGIPNCGTVQQRLETGLYEFKDSKGRTPVSYITFLEKQKFTMDDALDEVEQLGAVIDDIHFRPIETKKAPRGRPKKITGEIKADKPIDLYAALLPEKPKPTNEDNEATKLELQKEVDDAKDKKDDAKDKKDDAKDKTVKVKPDKEKAVKEKKRATTPILNETPVEPKQTKKTPVEPESAKQTKKQIINKVKYNGICYHEAPDLTLYELVPKGQESKAVGKWDPETKTVKPLEDDSEDEDESEDEYETEVGSEELSNDSYN
jgi:hypothetical protein